MSALMFQLFPVAITGSHEAYVLVDVLLYLQLLEGGSACTAVSRYHVGSIFERRKVILIPFIVLFYK